MMEQRHLILVDEQPQTDTLQRISRSLKDDGIELIYKYINPNDFQKRLASGNLVFDEASFVNEIRSIPFVTHLDVFATDYNLLEDDLKGIDVIALLNRINSHFHGRTIIYSAQIKEVINNIITQRAGDFDGQVTMLSLLAQRNITYLSSVTEFEKKFKGLIVDEPDITIDARLVDSLLALNNDKFKCSISGYTDKKISEIGQKLANSNPETIKLRKEITEQILAYITSIQDYE